MATKDSKPWEAEQAPAPAADAAKAAADAAANPDPDTTPAETPPAETPAEPVVETPVATKPVVAKLGKGKGAARVVVDGPQADIRLVNALSRGMSMQDAKKKFGIK